MYNLRTLLEYVVGLENSICHCCTVKPGWFLLVQVTSEAIRGLNLERKNADVFSLVYNLVLKVNDFNINIDCQCCG